VGLGGYGLQVERGLLFEWAWEATGYRLQAERGLLFEWAWEATRDRLSGAYCLSGLYRVRKVMDRKQRADMGKYSFVNSTITNRNRLLGETLGTFPCKPRIFRNGVRKAIMNGVK